MIDQAALYDRFTKPKYVFKDTWLEYISDVAERSATQEQAEDTIRDMLQEWADDDY